MQRTRIFCLFLNFISQKVDSRTPLEERILERSSRVTKVGLLEIYKPVPPAQESEVLWIKK